MDNIKNYILESMDKSKISEIKGFLTMLKTAFEDERVYFDENSNICIEKFFVSYMLQLLCIEPILASRCYRVIISILNTCVDKDFCLEIVELVKNKNIYINRNFHDSIVQIWHYYVISEYDILVNFSTVKREFEDNDINPIIISSLVINGKGKNKDIFDYIKDKYSSVEKNDGEPNYWKRSIMSSKWWDRVRILV